MRIQPHVWSASDPADWSSFSVDVFRNSIVTHGHPRAIAGALLHACLLGDALTNREVPSPTAVRRAIDWLRRVPALIHSDEDLAYLWLPRWQKAVGRSLEDALDEVRRECEADLNVLLDARGIAREDERWVATLAAMIDATSPAARGSGTKTALLAATVVWLLSDSPTASAHSCANALGADTDTIATMAGALAGAVDSAQPPSPVQDVGYISNEAVRMKAIADKKPAPVHAYPDLLDWSPAKSPLDLVGVVDGELVLAGLGRLNRVGHVPVEARSEVWEWTELPFAQRLLVKRRLDPRALPASVVPKLSGASNAHANQVSAARSGEPTLFEGETSPSKGGPSKPSSSNTRRRTRPRPVSVETRAQEVVRAGFRAEAIGRQLLELGESEPGGEAAAKEFAALVVRAYTESRKRESKKVSPDG